MEKGDVDMKDFQEPSVLDSCEQLIRYLKKWRPVIEESLEYALQSHTFDDVCRLVMMGHMQFFNFDNAFAIMEYKEYPRQKAYHCFLAGGDLQEVLACQYAIIEVARRAGCDIVSLSGRKGWERAFRNSGWEPLCTTLFKRIDQEG